MQKVILKRLLQLIPTLLVVITFTFAATRLIPGDPVAAMLGEQYDATKVDALREELGLNDPIPVQFGHYLVDILHGDFGDSYYFNTSAMNMIKARLPNTLMLSVTSLCIAILVGVFFGVISVSYTHLLRNAWPPSAARREDPGWWPPSGRASDTARPGLG